MLTQEQSSSTDTDQMKESLRELDEKKGKNYHFLLHDTIFVLKNKRVEMLIIRIILKSGRVLNSCYSRSSIEVHLKFTFSEITKLSGERYEPSTGVSDYYGELQYIDVSGLFRRLKEFDKTLTEITLNNMKEVDDVLMAVADFLAKMDCVTRISVANTRMNNTIGLVR